LVSQQDICVHMFPQQQDEMYLPACSSSCEPQVCDDFLKRRGVVLGPRVGNIDVSLALFPISLRNNHDIHESVKRRISVTYFHNAGRSPLLKSRQCLSTELYGFCTEACGWVLAKTSVLSYDSLLFKGWGLDTSSSSPCTML
jgi:hypothetical protein